MNKAIDRRILLAVAGAVALIVLAVALPLAGPSEESNSDRLVVAVTILPQAGFVEAIGGDKVDVVVMVPPGYSAHFYEDRPDLMVKLSRASMYAMVGSGVEFELAGMGKLRTMNKAMLPVDCSEGVQLLDMDEHNHDDDEHHDDDDHHHHTGPDPHVWLSVRNAMIMVRNICAGLVQVDPANKAYYEANCAAYLQQLQELDDEISVALAGVQNRRFIVFHPAWGYFAHDYDLIQIAVEQGGKEPDPQYQMRLIDEAREHDIRVVFVSPQFAGKSAEVIARAIDGEVVVINPLAKDFLDNMRTVASAMKQAMQ
ncbi:MAG: zinc ABC transporter substrate-binding protein [Dehalococcoidia bacterium]|nr:zinc ABC transporter substrate-binding protein [Dehalococcoidia bacterium]